MKKVVIFVCHGNICRSPAAEYIFKKLIKEQKRENEFEVYSRALSYEEIGNDIYPPMKRELIRQNIPYDRHSAEILNVDDYEKADYIFYMDESNRRIISRMFVDYKDIVLPIFKYADDISEVEDPWYTSRFELVVNQLRKCISNILSHI